MNRAISYTRNGNPAQVQCLSLWKTVYLFILLIQLFKLSTIMKTTNYLNKFMTDTIQGRYPWKPEIRKDLIRDDDPFYIAGNEGLAEVISLGDGIDSNQWKIGDWVVMGKPQLGTWQSHTNLNEEDLIKIPKSNNLTEVQAATMSVNMSTAYRMIKDYLPQSYAANPGTFFQLNQISILITRLYSYWALSTDTWIIQNGANSSVGQYVLQMCKAWNLGCIGLIRDRPNVEDLKRYLTGLGTENKTKIMTYEELMNQPKVTQSSEKMRIPLGLNCISGNEETLGMMKWMSNGARLITYGGMSMKPLVVPTSLLIFKDLKLEGFMLTNWRLKASRKEYKEMLLDLLKLVDQGHLVQHEHATIVDLDSQNAEQILHDTVSQSMTGKAGKKFLFRFV
ncbi:hypothetical protein PSHT_04271 [Puccinia striiformis]|uniref:Enoyl reductase (ER) domain-containing protein n=1 Tax=Puccinia striiformis TaxID=27350 RepID=A0A2S4WDH2_9BASI|nr:hypothetical protein PSHT_04271 [Puccinia striiformis]